MTQESLKNRPRTRCDLQRIETHTREPRIPQLSHETFTRKAPFHLTLIVRTKTRKKKLQEADCHGSVELNRRGA